MKKMATGGIVDPSDFDVQEGDTTTRTSPAASMMPPPPQIINQDGNRYEFSPGKEGSLTVRGNGAPPPPLVDTSLKPVAKAVPLPGMPPSVRPEDISNYLSQQKTGIDKYGADQQMGLENKIVDQRNSLGYKATDAGKGFADALMMGVARAGNPGFQKQFEDQQNEQGQQQLGAMQHANEANLQGQQAKMGVDAMDPKSVTSKTARDAYGPLFQKLGYKPGDIDGMSAANIQNALTLMTEYGGKQIEAQIKEYELAIEQKRLEGTLNSQRMEHQIATEKNQREALGDLSKMPWYSRVLHPGVSHALEDQAGMGGDEIAPDVTAYAQKHGITPQQALQVKKARGG